MDSIITNAVIENYRLRIQKVEKLFEGEGCNYSLTDDVGNKYILKVYGIGTGSVSFTTTVLNYLEKTSIKIRFPRPIRNFKGMNWTSQGDKTFLLLDWIEGTTMEYVNPKIAEEVGEAVSLLDDKLYDFINTNKRDFSKCEESIWSVTNIHKYDITLETIRHLLGDHYGMIKDTIADFDKRYPAIQNSLFKSLIHNDINPGNLLYDHHSKLLGIIDFAELSHTYRICEVGVALAYLMQIGGDDYLKIGQSFIRGYGKGYRFSKNEKDVLLLITKLRLSMTIMYNTTHVYSGEKITEVQAQFIKNAKILLTKLSDTPNWDFQEKLFQSADRSLRKIVADGVSNERTQHNPT